MRLKSHALLCIVIVIGCAQYPPQSALTGSRIKATIQMPPIQKPPPTPRPTPAEDTARYVEWMDKRGTPVQDRPREDVSLRVGDWGFFYHGGDRPRGSWRLLLDRVALDRSGRAVTAAEDGDWYEFLSTDGLDAEDALRRVAWLFNASPASGPGGARRDGVTAPTLTVEGGVVTFQGWWQAHTDPPYSRRITIVATKGGTKLVVDVGGKP